MSLKDCMNKYTLIAGLILSMGSVLAWPAEALIEVDITNFNVDPLPVAIPVFQGISKLSSFQDGAKGMGVDIAEVVAADLSRSGLFRPLSQTAFIERDTSPMRRPKFGDWRAINAQALVVGSVEILRDGRIDIMFRLWDVFAQQQITGVRYQTTPDNWRQIAHRIADAIYQRLTGEEGYFDTRIVYVAESGPATDPVKQLAIMDQDGANQQMLTDGRFFALTPRFSPTAQEITYLSYFQNRPRVYVYNVDTGKQEVLGDFEGMTFAPRFSPDGQKVIMNLVNDGNSDIYLMDLPTRRVRRLTDHPDIDTAASFSPDGDHIVFESDRGGSQQLYVMDMNGSGVKRISFGNGKYGTPVWSPRGDLIAFTHSNKGRYSIGVMRPDGSHERMLTESYFVEGPTWSPNGRVILFARQKRGGRFTIWSIDLTGRNERQIPTSGIASDPAWSPLIR